MRITLVRYLIFTLLFICCCTNAETQKWKDKNGVWHFSDKVNVSESNTAGHKPEKFSKKTKSIPSEENGKLVLKGVAHGHYYHYRGRAAGENLKIIVINHGMYGENKTEFIAAQQMIEPWFDFADKHGLILIAPIFDNSAFSVNSNEASNGGYRGLFGRDINADDFLHEIIAEYGVKNASYDGRFYLVGHSAGAQFSNRYMIKHPERVIAAAYSAPAWFALPDPDLKWPFGMGRRKFTEKWLGRALDKPIDIAPETIWWIKAAQIPTAIVVGEMDLSLIRHKVGVGGDNHVDRAKFWVKSIDGFARTHGVKSKQNLILVPNVGHRYEKLVLPLQNFIQPLL
ncbi:MAG: hypothetical protein V4732_11375 [Pseudomonadota bacterium]